MIKYKGNKTGNNGLSSIYCHRKKKKKQKRMEMQFAGNGGHAKIRLSISKDKAYDILVGVLNSL